MEVGAERSGDGSVITPDPGALKTGWNVPVLTLLNMSQSDASCFQVAYVVVADIPHRPLNSYYDCFEPPEASLDLCPQREHLAAGVIMIVEVLAHTRLLFRAMRSTGARYKPIYRL